MLFSFCLQVYIKLGNDFDRSVGAGKLTSRATRACMLIVFIMRHHHFATKTFR